LRQRAQIKIAGAEACGRLARGALDLLLPQFRLDRTNDARCYLVLQVEDVVERAVEEVGA
jgi:hypothetical protein